MPFGTSTVYTVMYATCRHQLSLYTVLWFGKIEVHLFSVATHACILGQIRYGLLGDQSACKWNLGADGLIGTHLF